MVGGNGLPVVVITVSGHSAQAVRDSRCISILSGLCMLRRSGAEHLSIWRYGDLQMRKLWRLAVLRILRYPGAGSSAKAASMPWRNYWSASKNRREVCGGSTWEQSGSLSYFFRSGQDFHAITQAIDGTELVDMATAVELSQLQLGA